MKTQKKNGWLIGLLAALGIGTAVGASAARGRIEPAPRTKVTKITSLDGVPLPALDRMVADLAAQARSKKN